MDRIVVVGGCSEACEEGCLRSVELSNGLEGFKISSVELREPRRSPALFRGASKGSALVIGGCSGPGRHVASADLLSVDGSVAGEGLESLGYEFSCAAFCTLPVSTCDRRSYGLDFGKPPSQRTPYYTVPFFCAIKYGT